MRKHPHVRISNESFCLFRSYSILNWWFCVSSSHQLDERRETRRGSLSVDMNIVSLSLSLFFFASDYQCLNELLKSHFIQWYKTFSLDLIEKCLLFNVLNIWSNIGFFMEYSSRFFSLFSIHKSEQTMVIRQSIDRQTDFRWTKEKQRCLLGPLKPEWTVKSLGTMFIFFLNGCSIRSEVKDFSWTSNWQTLTNHKGIISNTSWISNSFIYSNVFVHHLSDSLYIFLNNLSNIDVSISNSDWVNIHLFIFLRFSQSMIMMMIIDRFSVVSKH